MFGSFSSVRCVFLGDVNAVLEQSRLGFAAANAFFQLVFRADYFGRISAFSYSVFVLWVFRLGSKRFFHSAMLLMAAGLLNSWLKDFGQDARPAGIYVLDGRVGDSYGWPSGHAQIAVVLWGCLLYTSPSPRD